ncbi:hypothetical protein [Halomonas maura]|uniref:hypothetical protein n=1 Tax=Halomonas maura TaxID=117606 RepID=UPI0025B453F0|nr:hypothetical protein [Halomonas maura]MDN3556275.1 hypothetical protein [Halomonas maura]
MTRLVLHIDRLVLRGIDPDDAEAISAGLQAELQRRLAAPAAVDALVEGGDRARLRIQPHVVGQAPASGGRALGSAIADGLAGRKRS